MRRRLLPYTSDRPSMEYLKFMGPHRVSVGELSALGVPGVVFAPVTGPRCPAVVFGHGWMQPVGRYADTLRFLASWGFVAAAPDSERGPVPSHGGLALDMTRVADRLADAKLGGGRVTVDPARRSLAGHGIGGGAAVLAAASWGAGIKAVVTVSASETTPSAVLAATRVRVPGLHFVGADDVLSPAPSNGEAIARAWGGPVQLRRIKKARHLSLTEGMHWTSMLIGDGDAKGTQKAVRTLMTAFLMQHLSGQHQLAEGLSSKYSGAELVDLTPPAAPTSTELAPA
jgi:dienelactone hydrolase